MSPLAAISIVFILVSRMLLTVPIKLLTTHEQRASLLKTMYIFNAACDFISEFAFKNKVWNQFKLHHALYKTVREKFDLKAQFAIRAIGKVADTYKNDKQIQHKFRKNGSVSFDCRLLDWRDLETISIASNDERFRIQIEFGEYAKLRDRAIRDGAELVYRKRIFYLQAAVEVPEEQLKSCIDFVGVDLGITNVATITSGVKFSGKETDAVRIRYTELKRRLQKAGTKSAKRHLKRISRKERDFKRNTNHNISKQIVEFAQRHNVGIAIEDLQGIRKNITVSRAMRDRLGKWAFDELQKFIQYKAAIKGISVVLVDPRYTSQTCCWCGHKEKGNRNGEAFECQDCGRKMNADENAAINIRNRAINASELVMHLIILLSKTYIRAVVNQPIVAIEKQPPYQKGLATSSEDLSRSN